MVRFPVAARRAPLRLRAYRQVQLPYSQRDYSQETSDCSTRVKSLFIIRHIFQVWVATILGPSLDKNNSYSRPRRKSMRVANCPAAALGAL